MNRLKCQRYSINFQSKTLFPFFFFFFFFFFVLDQIFFRDPIVLESICYRTRAKRLINDSKTTVGLRKIWTGLLLRYLLYFLILNFKHRMNGGTKSQNKNLISCFLLARPPASGVRFPSLVVVMYTLCLLKTDIMHACVNSSERTLISHLAFDLRIVFSNSCPSGVRNRLVSILVVLYYSTIYIPVRGVGCMQEASYIGIY